jgi:enhancing lycopene biosynthesis protein 2
LPNEWIVLSGCGVYDGSEINEAISSIIHLSRCNAQVVSFAPDVEQSDVVDHLTAEESQDDIRNALVESARITRGESKPLGELNCDQFDALLFPGGFGVAKTLSDFESEGETCTVEPDVERVIREFHENGKPIGFTCIAPILAARVLGDKKISVTVGSEAENNPDWPYAGTTVAIRKMGADHIVTDVDEIHVDQENKIVTCAAYMYDTRID